MGEQFSLPLGAIVNGAVRKDIVLTPMTAKTRRLLTTKTNQKKPSAAMTQLLCNCCESIAGSPPTAAIMAGLTTGDRDFILLKLREISIGTEVSAQMNCQRCAEEISFDFDLSDIAIAELTKDEDFELDGDVPIVTLISEDLGIEVKLRLPTGIDQEAIAAQVTKDPVGASYKLYSRLIQSWTKNGEVEAFPNSVEFIDNLPLKEIDWLEEASRKAMPGPNWRVHLTCDLCSKSTLLDLSDSDFLFKTQR